MEQMIMMAMQTCQEYAQKSASTSLTEYEMLMYEQLCRLVGTYCKGHDLALRKTIPEMERDAMQAEAEHEEWLNAHHDDNDPPPDDEKKAA